jgi:redox-sensing transcriptional repressor
MLADRTIERLIVYHRILKGWIQRGGDRIYSHQLASLAGVTPAQVRRDIMAVNCAGNPARGYQSDDLAERIADRLGSRSIRHVALVGIGNLGHALLAHFARDPGHLSIVAAFDIDPAKTGREIQGCPCYAMDELETVITTQRIQVAILAVSATSAIAVGEQLAELGIAAILNLTPEHLRLPPQVRVENVDLGIALEKVAYFAGNRTANTTPTAAASEADTLPNG